MNESDNLNSIIKAIDHYYSSKVTEFGATPKGVDWNSLESQEIRFKQLCHVINVENDFSVLDYGCGFGSMYNYLFGRFFEYQYTGFDISVDMIRKALELNSSNSNFKVIQNENELNELSFDFALASGVFNVKLNNDSETWQHYIESEVDKLNTLSKRGFSFNMLTKYSDREYCKDYLHYADPEFWFARCKTLYSRNVALLHDYDLYEFTIVVRK